jgi:alpha-beta hydrolase superfamily lysophospholipase
MSAGGGGLDSSEVGGRLSSLEADDGYLLTYRIWDAAAVPPRGALVLLNGVMSHSLWFHPIARALVRDGLKLIGADRRGSGLNREARGDAPDARVLLDDLRAIITRERLPGRPLHLVGWCWGAVVAINLAAEIKDLSSLVLLAPGLFPTREVKAGMAALGDARRQSPEGMASLENPIREEMFTRGPALADFILADAHRLSAFTPRFYAIMMKLGMGAHFLLPRARVPILVVLARDDRATDNEDTVRGVARLTAGRAEVAYIDGEHGMQFDAPDALARVLAAWALDPARTGEGNP